MRIVIINPPHPSIGSRIPREHLPPLGLLSIGGPLIDAGHEVRLVDGEFGPMTVGEIVREVEQWGPGAVMLGHSGSTSAHPKVREITRELRRVMPGVKIIYGGVFPTYHWKEVLEGEPQIDVVVRGEGEETVVRVVEALEKGMPLGGVQGIAYRVKGAPRATEAAGVIRDLDAYRVGWELIDHARYSYWGDKRAVVVQFSRGCPHLCNYCGQRGFWTRWRHRDPKKFAAEIARLHREQGVEVFNFADENPTASKVAWKAFLEALIAEKVKVILVGSTRADDIVRDADILHLYKQAGVERWLMGMENYDEATLKKIKKGGSMMKDRQAIGLLRQHGILSMATWVIGFEEERDRDYWRGLKQLLAYDPDQIQMLFATPHRWTGFFRMEAGRRVIQLDQSKWDYKHQVLATRHMAPWRAILWMKFIEAVMQLRPRAWPRVVAHPDKSVRHAQRWYYHIGRKVWPYEIWGFLFRDKRVKKGPTLTEFWGMPQDEEEEAMKVVKLTVSAGRGDKVATKDTKVHERVGAGVADSCRVRAAVKESAGGRGGIEVL